MSFASTKDVIQVYQQDVSKFNLSENVVHTVFSKLLPKGVYFISYAPYMLTTNQANHFESITIWIGSGYASVQAIECANIDVEPYNYANMAYFTPSMSGVFSSDGEEALTIRVFATTTNSGTYGAYMSNAGSYDLNYIRLS